MLCYVVVPGLGGGGRGLVGARRGMVLIFRRVFSGDVVVRGMYCTLVRGVEGVRYLLVSLEEFGGGESGFGVFVGYTFEEIVSDK